jgi:hypothetical protein
MEEYQQSGTVCGISCNPAKSPAAIPDFPRQEGMADENISFERCQKSSEGPGAFFAISLKIYRQA